MTLKEQLEEMYANIIKQIPELAAQFDADTEMLVSQGVGTGGPGVGDRAPDFELPDPLGRRVSSAELRKDGPLVINFYRGGWCPYCNLELRALQQHLPQVQELGASLVAISPQLPDESMSMAEKNELSFPVLSDEGNAVARKFGLVFAVSEYLRPIYSELGADLPKFNGADTFELPVPATFIVDTGGIIRGAYVNADYKQRMEPDDILKALTALR